MSLIDIETDFSDICVDSPAQATEKLERKLMLRAQTLCYQTLDGLVDGVASKKYPWYETRALQRALELLQRRGWDASLRPVGQEFDGEFWRDTGSQTLYIQTPELAMERFVRFKMYVNGTLMNGNIVYWGRRRALRRVVEDSDIVFFSGKETLDVAIELVRKSSVYTAQIQFKALLDAREEYILELLRRAAVSLNA